VFLRGTGILVLALAILSGWWTSRPNQAQEKSTPEEPSAESTAESVPRAYLFQVPLPITGDVDDQVKRQIERQLNQLKGGAERPVFVLEFAAPKDRSGEGSQFERALSLARFLASEPLSRVRTVAYLPRSVKGHAVLPVMACEEIAVAENIEFGEAARGEPFVDATMRESYSRIADLRRTIPTAVAIGMMDASEEVLRVELVAGGTQYVLGSELAKLQQEGAVSKVETIAGRGDLVNLTGRQMRVKYGFAAHLVSDRTQLANALKVPPDSLSASISNVSGWKIVRLNLVGRMNAEQATRATRLIQDRLREGSGFLLILCIDSPGGSPLDSQRLAAFLAELDRRQTRTCAFVMGEARSDAGLVALACDDLAMTSSALIGGPGDRFISREQLADLREPVRAIAKAKSSDWSLMMAMLDTELQVFRCTREGTGEVRYFSADERSEQPDADVWKMGEPISTAEGLSTAEMNDLDLLRFSVEQFEDLPPKYGVTSPPEMLEADWFISRIEHIASQPWFSRTLLFVAFFALITEASTPGLGVPGFLSGVCFLLFFWAQFLNGTAGWLEVLLFAGGIACLIIELMVLPGFGVFGIGGSVMVIASIILASQTFVIPQNSYQLGQMPGSMFTVAAAGFGSIAAIYFMRRYLAHTPWLKNLLLEPPQSHGALPLNERESIVDFMHLLHKTGMTTTQLTPSGKARFGDLIVDVITDGDMVPPGSPVRVVEVLGNRILVQALPAKG
jgi:membrane-bound ClpP family serine protease